MSDEPVEPEYKTEEEAQAAEFGDSEPEDAVDASDSEESSGDEVPD